MPFVKSKLTLVTLFVFAIVAIPCQPVFSQEFSTNSIKAILGHFENGRAVICFNESQKCVVIDKQGTVVIAPESLSPKKPVKIGEFRNGLAQVQIGPYSDAKVGFIDINGNWAIKPIFHGAGYFSETDNLVNAQKEQDGKWGYVDKKGKWIIPPRYYEALAFSHGYATVRVSKLDDVHGLWGVIDRKGKWAIPPTDKSENGVPGAFTDQGAWLFQGGKHLLVAFYTGKPLSRMYDAFLDFNEGTGVGRFCNGPTGTGFNPIYTACYEVNRYGRERSIPMPLIVHYQNREFVANAVLPHDGIYIMATANSPFDDKGLVTEDGRWVLGPSSAYDFIDYAGEGKWRVSIRKGSCKFVKDATCDYYVNNKGKADPPVEFWIGDDFSDGLAAVTQEDGTGGYLKDGSWGISPETLQKNLARWYKAEDEAIATNNRKRLSALH